MNQDVERRFLLKVAALPDEPDEKELEQGSAMLPKAVWPKLRRAFTPKGLPFFELYIQLRRTNREPPPQDLRRQFILALNRLQQVTSPVDHKKFSPPILEIMDESKSGLGNLLQRIVNGTANTTVWRQINDRYVPLIQAVTRDKGIYLAVRQTGAERWPVFRRMSAKQEKVEKLRDNDPESYALMEKYKETIGQIETKIERKIGRAGLEVKRGFLMGRPVIYGFNPETQEGQVYDLDGDVLSREEYIEKRKAQAQANKELSVVGSRATINPDRIRTVSDEHLQKLEGPTEWVALTDDKAKQGRLTRIFSTKKLPVYVGGDEDPRVESYSVITSGRFKGALLDDMVNVNGRLIEGTAYRYAPASGRSSKVPQRIDPGEREVYTTTAEVVTTRRIQGKVVKRKEKKLFLTIPKSNAYKELRQALKKLACNAPGGGHRGCIPSITYQAVEGSRAATFYFDPKDFAAVLETVEGMSLSKSALETVESYYEDLQRADQATAEENLGRYSASALGGFKTTKKDPVTGDMRAVDFNTKQKQAIAWLAANGGSGVCALDTGVGKTLVGIGMMQKALRDGLTDAGASYQTPTGKTVKTNGRFLYVCPPKLKGNLPKEIRAFMSDPKQLLDRVDVISYTQFSGSSKSRKVPRRLRNVPFWKGRDWDPSLYVSIFFDEAHQLGITSREPSKEALKLWHPRKVCLTASPMEDNPMEAYALAAVSNNTPLFGNSLEAQQNKKEKKRFKERFCEVVGGHIVGVVQDPTTKRDLQTWVKRNIFYANKTEVPESNLPTLKPQTSAVEMDPVVEDIYRDITGEFAAAIGGLVSRYKYKGKNKDAPKATDPAIDEFFKRRMAVIIKTLNSLANYPEVALFDIATMLKTGNLPYPDSKGRPVPVPDVLQPMLKKWSQRHTPEELQVVAGTVGNPKLEAAEEFLRSKLAQTQGASRSLVFTDDKRLCEMAVRHMAKTIPGRHALAMSGNIFIYEGTRQLDTVGFEITPEVLAETLGNNPEEAARIMSQTGGWSIIPLPFKEKAYQPYPMLPAKGPNTHYRADNWPQFVFNEVINPDRRVKTCTLYGPAYQYGQNLQAFDTVVHLDRDTWDAESMKQRTARAWRTGQKNPVDEVTVDATYRDDDDGVPRSEFDKTLDEIRKLIQEVDISIFEEIIHESQQIASGEEWSGMGHRGASNFHLDKKLLELAASPYVSRSQPTGA